jgi:hypothetical protein
VMIYRGSFTLNLVDLQSILKSGIPYFKSSKIIASVDAREMKPRQ